jgi:hypothetical protein
MGQRIVKILALVLLVGILDLPAANVCATGFVGSGNIPRFTLMGVDDTSGDTVMVIGKNVPQPRQDSPNKDSGHYLRHCAVRRHGH